jgi:xanthine dehydrogenase accessory factor
MMFVGKDKVLGSIGGGEPEYLAICQAKEHPGCCLRKYTLNNTAANGLDMICGGNITVLFIPV